MTPYFDIEPLVTPVSEVAPCGDNLEYDPEFQALELAVSSGEWADVQRQGLVVAQRTRDLRVALFIARAGLHTSGYTGFASGLALIAELLEVQWQGLHPALEDLDEGLPPTRLNLLASLGVSDSSSLEESMLSEVRATAFVQLQGLGKYSFRDVLVAQGELALGEDEAAIDLATIKGALKDADKTESQATLSAIESCLSDLSRITQSFLDQLGAAWAPDFQPLSETLTKVRDFIAVHAGLNSQTAGTTEIVGDTAGTPILESSAALVGGPIASRQDAVRVLSEVCDYFERHEPSSPVPLLLKRASRLVDMDFIDLLRDLSPDGIAQIEQIAGLEK